MIKIAHDETMGTRINNLKKKMLAYKKKFKSLKYPHLHSVAGNK